MTAGEGGRPGDVMGAIPLIQGLKSEVVVRDPVAREVFRFEPLSYEEAVRRVLAESPRP